MTEFWQTILGILGSIGTGGGIVLGLSSWLGKIWAGRLMAKETAKYREELERLTKQLERKNHISKVRFDAEFTMYRKLSQKCFQMANLTADLWPNGVIYCSPEGENNKDEQISKNKEKFNQASDAYNSAYNTIMENAPFISEKMFEKFNSLRVTCRYYILAYRDYYCMVNSEILRKNNHKDFSSLRKNVGELKDKLNNLVVELRDYLKRLDVLEQG